MWPNNIFNIQCGDPKRHLPYWACARVFSVQEALIAAWKKFQMSRFESGVPSAALFPVGSLDVFCII